MNYSKCNEIEFVSLFAGVGGFDLGFEQSGMKCAAQVEIDKAARFVLNRRWPTVPKIEDVRNAGINNLPKVPIICGGFPCQDLSVAGSRAGFLGNRSSLFFEMVRITDELRPDFLIWENVPGLLSSRGGADFWRVLSELDTIGYCGAWTMLDAQWFGLAQRRRRIFGVFARRDIGATRCAEILALADRLRWNPTQGREAATNVTTAITKSLGAGGADGNDAQEGLLVAYGGNNTSGTLDIATACNAKGGSGRMDFESETFVVKGAAIGRKPEAGPQYGEVLADGTCYTLNSTEQHAVVFQQNTRDEIRPLNGNGQLAGALAAQPGMKQQNFIASSGVRRLTPTECERLQGFPDGHTAGQPDSARYRQLGNAVAVPCVRWIGERLLEVMGVEMQECIRHKLLAV